MRSSPEMTFPKTNKRVAPFFLLFILFSLTALFIHSLNIHISSPSTPSHFSPPPQTFTFTIKLLAFDRLDSLSRCLRSLSNAHYSNDRVNLHIYIDHFKHTNNSEDPILDTKLDESRQILDFVDGFLWKFGDKVVHYRTGNVGLQAQWLEAWWPVSDHDFAFVVEDDLELSPFYYMFLRRLILNYYYNSSNYSPYIYGASLQRPRFVPGKHGNKLQLDSKTRLLLYQLVGTWGQLLFPKPWKEFRLWYDKHKEKGNKPILQGMVTTGWYKKMGERIWTPWFIKFIHSHGYFNIYTNFLRERALSVSHRDAGVNYGKTAGPDSQLLDEGSLDFKLLEMHPLSSLKWYDFCFSEVLPGRVVKNFEELGSVLDSVQKDRTLLLVSIFKVSQMVIKNMLCHFERLNIRNYILVGPNSRFLLDLARRGHPVIDADQLLHGMRADRLKNYHGPHLELIKEIIVEAYVIKKCVESRYNSWVIDANMVPISSDIFATVDDFSSDIFATKESELLFVRSSPSVTEIWVEKFVDKIVAIANSLISRTSFSRDHHHFRFLVVKALEENDTNIKVGQLSLGSYIGTDLVVQTSIADGRKVLFWSPGVNVDIIQKKLADVGMWVIDTDDSCTAVVCHQS